VHLHPRVDLHNGSYTLVPEGGDEGGDRELQYVDVVLTPKIGTEKRLTCGPSLVRKHHSAGNFP
jgi:hypothetical protein